MQWLLARAARRAPRQQPLRSPSLGFLARTRLRSTAATPPTPTPAEAPPSWTARLAPLGLWGVVSLNIGAFFSQGDEGVQVLLNLDEFTESVLSPSTTRPALEKQLERLARGSALNDTLKLELLHAPRLAERLIELLTSDAPQVSTTCRNHAAKTLEYMTSHPTVQLELVSLKLHLPLVALLTSPGSSMYVKKTLATAMCNLAAQEENLVPLAEAGAFSALHDEQELSPKLRRQRVAVTLLRVGASLGSLPSEALAAVPSRDRELVQEYAQAEAEAAQQPLHAVRASIIESGVLLYLHTAAGGAAWGLFESLRLGESRAALTQNVVRTCLVTCFVPILMVGGVVSSYAYVNRTTDTVDEKFYVYFASCLALYPAGKLLQWVEAFAPLWLGGHIVGFFSFFVWTLYTESDLLRSDRDLLATAR